MKNKIKEIHKTITFSELKDRVAKSKNASIGFDMMGITSGYTFDSVTLTTDENGNDVISMESSVKEDFFNLNLGIPKLMCKIIDEDKNFSQISLHIGELDFIMIVLFLGY